MKLTIEEICFLLKKDLILQIEGAYKAPGNIAEITHTSRYILEASESLKIGKR